MSEDNTVAAFLVCVPGNGGSGIVTADSKQAAANQFCASTGYSTPTDADGNETTSVAVIELDTVQVKAADVDKVLNPSKSEE